LKEVLFRLRLLLRIVLRKARTLLQGPPTHPEFIRAAHYFSDGWALNMWQILDPARVLSELRTIQDDGFNTVILVVPWRGFQIDQLHPAYDEFYERQIRRVMRAAEKLGLSVIVRVGYSNQVFVDSHLSGITQAQRLLIDAETRTAWLDYLQRLYRICHGYRSFRQGFLSWEEFWHAFAHWQLREQRPRRKIAETSGFIAYLSARGIDNVSEIPRPGEALQGEYHGFTNKRIRDMYECAVDVFPGLGMEIRVDKERLPEGDSVHWASNDDYADIEPLRYTYWAPFMGATNEGEKLDAGEAAHLFEYMLDEVSCGGDRANHVVDQFNFVDETPAYKGVHAEIVDEEVADFLQLAVPLLRAKSLGYGIWAHRDYRQNVLFNARFLMGLRGWEIPVGRVRALVGAGARLAGGAVLRQFLPSPVSGLQRSVGFSSLRLVLAARGSVRNAQLQVRINAAPWQDLEFGHSHCEALADIGVDFGSVMADGLILEIRNTGGTVDIESVALFHWTFRGGIRLEDGTPARHHQAVVDFNRALESYPAGAATDRTG
jgi:hypothetical protein